MLPKAVSILETLISMDTTSSKSNLPLVDWVEAYVTALGATVERFSSDSKAKAALWITFGPAAKQGLVLSGHTDTVPAVESSWKSDPFKLDKRDNRLYGRGACDMKGFIAACLAALPRLARQELLFPIYLSLSYDEEVGIVGVRPMLRCPTTTCIIVGSPTGTPLATRLAETTSQLPTIVRRVSSPPSHSAAPTAVTPRCSGRGFVSILDDFEQSRRWSASRGSGPQSSRISKSSRAINASKWFHGPRCNLRQRLSFLAGSPWREMRSCTLPGSSVI